MNYEGHATLVAGTDETPVTASLSIVNEPTEGSDGGFITTEGVLSTWQGTLTSESVFAVKLGFTYGLRLSDGKVGRVRIRSVDLSSNLPAQTIMVTGEGPAPFA